MTTAEAPRRRQVLDLSTLVPDRPFIRINGTAYDLRVPEDFGLVEHTRMGRVLERLAPLVERVQGAPDSIVDEDVAETSRLLREAVELFVVAPPEVLATLSDLQRLAVVQAFREASETRSPAPTPNRASRRTGARSSRRSAPRTASTAG